MLVGEISALPESLELLSDFVAQRLDLGLQGRDDLLAHGLTREPLPDGLDGVGKAGGGGKIKRLDDFGRGRRGVLRLDEMDFDVEDAADGLQGVGSGIGAASDIADGFGAAGGKPGEAAVGEVRGVDQTEEMVSDFHRVMIPRHG